MVTTTQAELRREPRWFVLVTMLASAGLYLALPQSLTLIPSWEVLAVIALLLIPTSISHQTGQHLRTQRYGYLISGLLTLFLCASVSFLIRALIQGTEQPIVLLRSAGVLWVANVLLFAGWYWRLDAGGPIQREKLQRHEAGAFLFPQMTLDHARRPEGWRPEFLDYLFIAFTASAAFSPTDTAILSRWAKVLLMVQAIISILIIGVLAARAVNIL